MKECTVCKLEKNDDEFHKKLNGLGSYCKVCRKIYDAKYKVKNRKRAQELELKRREEKELFIVEYFKQHPCEQCNETNILVLTFDHINPLEKKFEITDLIRTNRTIKILKEEIKKCKVLCCNCHACRSAIQHNSWRLKYS